MGENFESIDLIQDMEEFTPSIPFVYSAWLEMECLSGEDKTMSGTILRNDGSKIFRFDAIIHWFCIFLFKSSHSLQSHYYP